MPSATAAGLAGLDDVAAELADAGVGYERSQMFGCPGLRRPGKGKFFVTLWGDDLVVKVSGDAHAEALAIEGAHRFEPMPGRAMGDWVVVPASARARWSELARRAEAGLA